MCSSDLVGLEQRWRIDDTEVAEAEKGDEFNEAAHRQVAANNVERIEPRRLTVVFAHEGPKMDGVGQKKVDERKTNESDAKAGQGGVEEGHNVGGSFEI